MSVLSPLVTYALVGLPVGLLTGMLLGPIANRVGGMGGYDSLRRRAARLGHVAAVMLPLIAGFYALAFQAWGLPNALVAWAAPLWVYGGIALVAVLFGTAWRPRVRYLLPLPATALTTAAILLALGILPVVA